MSIEQLTAQINALTTQIGQLKSQVSGLSREVEIMNNSLQSNLSTTASVSSKLDLVSADVTSIEADVSEIPTDDVTAALAAVSSALNTMNTQLANIENAILIIPHDDVFDDMTARLLAIQTVLGTPPSGQNIWSRLSTISTVTVSDETDKVRVYGTISGDMTCPLTVTVYECMSNAVATTVYTTLAEEYEFQFYVVPGRYVVEISGETIKTASLTIDVPEGVTEFNATP